MKTNQEPIVWDSSNIAESYSGVVLPLTCSFAQDIYRIVYENVARSSRVPEKKIQAYNDVFVNLLGFHYGRFYYNMNNWYKMLTLFPGSKRNRDNLNQMITAKSNLSVNYLEDISLWLRITYYPHLLFRYLSFDKDILRFTNHVEQALHDFYGKEYGRDMAELISLYHQMRKDLLFRWSITVDNDFLAMTFFGWLKKSALRGGVSEQDIVGIISDMDHLVSAEQVEALRQVAQQFGQYPTLVQMAKQERFSECQNLLCSDKKYEPGCGALTAYLEKYGGRFANELRLETPDLDSDPAHIIKRAVRTYIPSAQ
jgi:pyruvate,water dikinase